jgi:hypothetical protein
MKISRKPTPPRPTAPSRPSRLVLASLRDGEIVDVENISKYVTPELAYVVRVERAKKPRLADRTASPPISLRVLIMRPEEGVGRSCIGRRPNHNGPTSRRNGPLGAREPGPSEAQRTARSERGPRSSGRTRPGPDRRRRARRGSATISGTGMPGSPTANGAPLDLDAHAVPGLLARSDEIKVSCLRACVRIPRSRCYGAAGRNADILGRE